MYAIFRAEGLRDGDKGILGYRKECSPYVVMYNDLVMVFYHHEPTYAELTIGPINVQREMLNNWHEKEKSLTVDRRWFWDVRDWIDESSYEFYDPVREETLRTIRETERSEDRVINDDDKRTAIKVGRLQAGPQGKLYRIRKLERMFGVWMRKKEAKEKGSEYDPLKDEDFFLQQRDFDMYYKDLAALSRIREKHDVVPKFPFYEEARQAIPDEREWKVVEDDENDNEFMEAMDEFLGGLSIDELDSLWGGAQETYVNPYAGISRNDPCPCGSGKKFKKCCGKDL